MRSDTFICPFCGKEIKRGNGHHNCIEKKIFLKKINFEDLKSKYADDEYSILDLGIYVNEKYKDCLYSIIPDSTIRKWIKTYYPECYRNIKSSVNTNKKRKKYENTMIEHFGCKHNFEKNCSSRKQWEQRLFEEEGITNVFQRQSVKDKSLETLLQKYGTIENIKKMRGYCSTKEYFQEKYGDDWETEWTKFINKKRITKELYQEKYGDDWEYYWNEHLENLKNRFYGNYTGLNEKCYEILNKYGIEFTPEYPLNIPGDSHYGKGYYLFYDIKIKNLLIELNGTYWHCDPRKYESTDIVNFPGNTYKRVQDVWDKDKYKTELAKQNGFFIETIWEKDISEEMVINILKKYNLWKE